MGLLLLLLQLLQRPMELHLQPLLLPRLVPAL